MALVLEQDPVEQFLAHHGVKGQKWGVRKQRRIQGVIDRQYRLATKKATFGDRLRLANYPGVFTQKGALRNLKRGADLQASLKRGDAFAGQFLTKKGRNTIKDLNYHQTKQVKKLIRDLGAVKRFTAA